MGFEIRCKECKCVLLKQRRLPKGVTWYSDFRYKFEGECPNCGHELPKFYDYLKAMKLEILDAKKISK